MVLRGHNRENHVHIEKIFFSRTSRPISIKLGTNLPCVKRITNCSKEGPGSFPRGDNHGNAKIGWDHSKIFFSRATQPEELIMTGKLSDIM
jgi:hypothetical protein